MPQRWKFFWIFFSQLFVALEINLWICLRSSFTSKNELYLLRFFFFQITEFFDCRFISLIIFPTNIYFFKVKNRNTSERCEICSKFTIKHQNDVKILRKINISYILIAHFNLKNNFGSLVQKIKDDIDILTMPQR